MDRKNFLLQFKLNCKETECGDSVYLSGNVKELGCWDITKSVKLFTSQETFPLWESLEILFDSLPQEIEYKYFIKTSNDEIKWETFLGNRIFSTENISLDNTRSIIINGENFNESKIRKSTENDENSQIFNSEADDSKMAEIIFQATDTSQFIIKHRENENEFDLNKFLSELKACLDNVINENGKLKEQLKQLMLSFKHKRKIDKEFLLLIFIHFVKSGQLRSPDSFSEFYEHKHHHDPSLARSIYTYLLSNINDDNSLLIRSILSYVPTCSNYRVNETNDADFM
jgi:hypothetical protein